MKTHIPRLSPQTRRRLLRSVASVLSARAAARIDASPEGAPAHGFGTD